MILEGFENYGPVDTEGPNLATAMQARWIFANANGAAKIVEGRCGGKALQILVDEQNWEATQFALNFETGQHITVGMAFYYGAQDRTVSPTYIDSKWWGLLRGNVVQLRCRIGCTGEVWFTIPAENGDDTTRIYTSQVKTHGWHYYEWKIFIDPTAGSIETRIDGTVVSTVTGQDTGTSCNGLYLCSRLSDSQLWAYDDLYVTYGAVSQDYLGLICIESMRPSSDVVADWSGSTPHYDIVGVDIFDVNTYISGDTLNTVDTWHCGPLDKVDTDIIAAQMTAMVKLDTGGGRQLDLICESNTSEATVSSKIISLTETGTSLVLETDPDGSTQWTVSALEAANYSIRVGD
jgi:hypothetical protein